MGCNSQWLEYRRNCGPKVYKTRSTARTTSPATLGPRRPATRKSIPMTARTRTTRPTPGPGRAPKSLSRRRRLHHHRFPSNTTIPCPRRGRRRGRRRARRRRPSSRATCCRSRRRGAGARARGAARAALRAAVTYLGAGGPAGYRPTSQVTRSPRAQAGPGHTMFAGSSGASSRSRMHSAGVVALGDFVHHALPRMFCLEAV